MRYFANKQTQNEQKHDCLWKGVIIMDLMFYVHFSVWFQSEAKKATKNKIQHGEDRETRFTF